jgi:hypothetical protein
MHLASPTIPAHAEVFSSYIVKMILSAACRHEPERRADNGRGNAQPMSRDALHRPEERSWEANRSACLWVVPWRFTGYLVVVRLTILPPRNTLSSIRAPWGRSKSVWRRSQLLSTSKETGML